MSAVTSWDAPAPLAAQRAHLRSVPTGAAVVERSSLAITRRGRLVLSVAVLTVVMGVLAGAGISIANAQGRPAVPTVTVQAGQTLSEVAHRAYPQLPVANAVARVQLANGLNSTQVQVGQRLQLPG